MKQTNVKVCLVERERKSGNYKTKEIIKKQAEENIFCLLFYMDSWLSKNIHLISHRFVYRSKQKNANKLHF